MKNILIVATHTPRFLDQLNFAMELYNKTNRRCSVKFFIGADVYRKYTKQIENMPFSIINNVNPEGNGIYSNAELLKKIIKNTLTVNQIRSLVKLLFKLKCTVLFGRKLKISSIIIKYILNKIIIYQY